MLHWLAVLMLDLAHTAGREGLACLTSLTLLGVRVSLRSGHNELCGSGALQRRCRLSVLHWLTVLMLNLAHTAEREGLARLTSLTLLDVRVSHA